MDEMCCIYVTVPAEPVALRNCIYAIVARAGYLVT